MDELIGEWTTDNSAGIHVMYGTIIKFDRNGRGTMHTWGGGDDVNDLEDPKYDDQFDIEWVRVNQSTIKIKTSNDPEWTVLEYEISDTAGIHDAPHDKITSTNNHPGSVIKEWFWYIPEPLYREK